MPTWPHNVKTRVLDSIPGANFAILIAIGIQLLVDAVASRSSFHNESVVPYFELFLRVALSIDPTLTGRLSNTIAQCEQSTLSREPTTSIV